MNDQDRKRVEEIRRHHADGPNSPCEGCDLLAIIDRQTLDRQCVATPEDVERVTRAVRGHVEYAKQARAALRAMGYTMEGE